MKPGCCHRHCVAQLTVNVKVLLLSHTVTAVNAVILAGSVASWFIFVAGYAELFSLSQGNFFGIAEQIWQRPVRLHAACLKCNRASLDANVFNAPGVLDASVDSASGRLITRFCGGVYPVQLLSTTVGPCTEGSSIPNYAAL
jgi:hypothetical protein